MIEIQNKYLIWQNPIEIAKFCLDCVSLLFDSPKLFMNQHLLDYVNLYLPQWHSTPDGAMFIIPNRLQTYGYSTAWPQFQRQDGVFSEMSLLLITIIGNSKYFVMWLLMTTPPHVHITKTITWYPVILYTWCTWTCNDTVAILTMSSGSDSWRWWDHSRHYSRNIRFWFSNRSR